MRVPAAAVVAAAAVVGAALAQPAQPNNNTVTHRPCQPPFDTFPFCDTSLSVEQRVADLVSRILPEEKGPLLAARGSPRGNLFNLSRIGVPAFDWGENSLHGDQVLCLGSICPTTFAMPNLLGATWNMSLVEGMGAVIGNELRAFWLAGATEASAWSGRPPIGLDVWSPVINVNRDPRWGRNQEVAGEDPLLLGEYAKAYTVGVQQGSDPRYLQAVSTLKHWVAYSLEDSDGFTRYGFDALVGPYDLAETYFPAWRAGIVDAQAKGVMCSYNALNGVPTCASAFLRDILRGSWNFTGYMTSDTDAVANIFSPHNYTSSPQAAACKALTDGACDINSGDIYWHYILNATQEGLCGWDVVDAALTNSFRIRFQLGLFDPIEDQPYWHVPLSVVGTPQTQALNLLASQQGMVLLKNEGPTLPLPAGARIAVLGPHANATAALVGSYLGQLCPGDNVNDFSCLQTPFAAIAARNAQGGAGAQTTIALGCDIDSNDTSGFAAALALAKAADYVVLMMGIDETVEGESNDRTAIDLPGVQHAFVQLMLSAQKPTVLVLFNGGMVAIEPEKASVPAILEAWYPGTRGSEALASVLFGDYNPGGKLPITIYPASFVDEIAMDDMNMTDSPGRSYKYYTGETLFPFGFGLSYTTFTLAWSGSAPAPVTRPTQPSGWTSNVTLSVRVANTGRVDGDEVVQLYLRPLALPTQPDSKLLRRLSAFERVHVPAGTSTVVSFVVSPATLRLVDLATGDGVLAPGSFALDVTNGVDQILTASIALQGPQVVVQPFGT